jgi:hypothetical protein
MSGVQGMKASNSSWEGDFPGYGSFTSTRCRWANGSTPFAFALATMEYMKQKPEGKEGGKAL